MNALLLYPESPETYWSFRHALPFQGKRSSYPPLGLLTIAALVRQGMLGDARASYWKFLIDAATRYRHAFGAAVTLAIMGYHFYTVTEEACRTA